MSATALHGNNSRFVSNGPSHAVARSALTSTTRKDTPGTPVTSAIWQITIAGDCVDPIGNQGNSETVLHRNHSVEPQTPAMPATRATTAYGPLTFRAGENDRSSLSLGSKRR